MSTEIRAQNSLALTSVKAIKDATDEANRLVDELEQDVTALDTRIGTAEGKVTTLESNVSGLNTRVTTAESDIATVEGDITTLQGRVSNAEEDVDATLRELSVAQDVVGTINWITNHGTMTNQTGQTFDSNQVYFVVDPNGDYLVGGTRYAVVPEPVASDINNYYVLSISESVQNYVATHLVVDSEGLWIIPDAGGNKVLIATGQGATYSSAGTYVVGSSAVLASFTADGAQIGQTDSTQSCMVLSADGMQITRYIGSGNSLKIATLGVKEKTQGGKIVRAPYYTLGTRKAGSNIGNYSMASGGSVTASAQYSYAEGTGTTSSGLSAHAEGCRTIASGSYSHSQNYETVANYAYQTAIGKHNDNQTNTAFEIGNGTSATARSNAFTVDWDGNVVASGNITASGNVSAVDVTASGTATADNFLIDLSGYQTTGSVDKELYDAIVALGWDSDVLIS